MGGYGDGGSGDKIKGGDVLIFRMEILKIKGPKKRLVKCEYNTPDKKGCDEEEIKVYEEWSKKGLPALESKLESLKAKTKETLKKGEYEKIAAEMAPLKPVLKALKKEAKKSGDKKKEKEEL